MKLSKNTQLNLKALGLSLYIYILLLLLFNLIGVVFAGGGVVKMLSNTIGFIIIFLTAWIYIYIPIQLLLFWLAKWIIKKSKKEDILTFIYLTAGIFALILLFLTFNPLPGWR